MSSAIFVSFTLAFSRLGLDGRDEDPVSIPKRRGKFFPPSWLYDN